MGENEIGSTSRAAAAGAGWGWCRTMADSSLAAVVVTDPAFVISYANEEAARILGWSRERLAGRSFLEFVEDKSLPLLRYYQECTSWDDYVSSRFEFAFVRADGERRLADCTLSRLDEPGAAPAMAIQFVDLTERQRAREDIKSSYEIFRVIFESAPDGIYLSDLRGQFMDGNTMTETITGFSKGELVGKNFVAAGLLSGDQMPKAAVLLAKNARGRPTGPDEFVLTRRDGSQVPVEISTYPIKLGGKTLVLGIARDISVRRRAEEEQARDRENLENLVRERTRELEEATRHADAASQAKSVFLANMSHEIRTPINAIMGFSQLLQRDAALSAEQRKHLSVINRSGEHLLAIITDILEMSKIEAGRTILNPVTFDLRALVGDLELMFGMRCDGKQLTFIAEGPGDDPLYLEGDEGKLRQVLINLLGNAVKFAEAGRIVLRVRASRLEDGRVEVEAEVEDTGPGIPADEQPGLFKPFQQTQAGRRVKAGTGLGLAICKEYVTLMGGDISVVSRPQEGSCFKFRVVMKEGDLATAAKGPETRRVAGLRPGRPEWRVLVADDEELNRAFLSKLLGGVGFRTRVVADGMAALEAFEAWRPHLIVLDIRMPEMNGCEVARRIRESEGGADVKIVAVSAAAFEDDRREALEAGADDFLAKPFREGALFDRVGRLLGVEYEYDDGPGPAEPGADASSERVEITAEALAAALSKPLLKKMRRAVIQADYDGILSLIGGLDGPHRSLAGALRGLVERYEYKKLLELLRSS